MKPPSIAQEPVLNQMEVNVLDKKVSVLKILRQQSQDVNPMMTVKVTIWFVHHLN
jgi:hypothetical protein